MFREPETMLVQLKHHAPAGFAPAHEIAPDGRIVTRPHPLAVHLPKNCIGAADAGTLWSIEGETTKHSFLRNGYRVKQDVIRATTATLQRPSGELLAQWISRNVPSIGLVIARRLVRALPDIDTHVRQHDTRKLCTVAGMSEPRAHSLIEHWPSDELHEVITWLEGAQLPLGIAERLCRTYGQGTVNILSKDPFYLLGFGIPFSTALALANSLGIDPDDDRVAAAIAEHAAAQITTRTGSTVITGKELSTEIDRKTRSLHHPAVQRGPQAACETGSLLRTHDGYQATGHAVMERLIARYIRNIATRPPGTGALLAAWEKDLSPESVRNALTRSEANLSIRLTDQQKRAAALAFHHPVALISGEAGTGKTTIIRTILEAFDELCDIPTFLVALSGRAARRMSEASGRKAHTIAKFISDHRGKNGRKLPEHLLLVIDEASMVDLLTAYRLVDVLPDSVRMLWVGDEAQLPPVGPGLVFHALMQAGLPALRLSQVKRHAAASEIHRVANTIRNGQVPQVAPLHADVDKEVAYTTNWSLRHVAELWLRNGGAERTIILSPTKVGPGGVDEINSCLQDLMGRQRPAVRYSDHTRGWIPWISPRGHQFHLDDRVMVTRNDYEADIRNGDLGTITELFPAPDRHGAGAAMTIEGRSIPLTLDVLNSLSLGYAVTVHKSQGSQWPVCILMLPPHASHMTDRSLLYTAATRASERLILCGDFALVRHGVTRISRSTGRRTNLPRVLDAST